MKGEIVIHRRPRNAVPSRGRLTGPQLMESAREGAAFFSQRHGLAFAPTMEPALSIRESAGLPQPEEDPVRMLARVFRAPAESGDAAGIVNSLMAEDSVEAAYFKPAAEPAGLNGMSAAPAEPAGARDFTPEQGYLGPAPEGVDAAWASQFPGGRGAGVRVVDVEGQWRFSHECFRDRLGGTLSASTFNDIGWRNHGTAVMGILWGQGMTLTGIVPEAEGRGISIDQIGSAGAVLLAGEFLRPGDLLLLELHRPGPRHHFETRDDQHGFIPVEWWPDDRAAIQSLVSRGIVVIGAAGNGAQDLDDPLYDVRPAAGAFIFPVDWVNPLRRRGATTLAGALVGAGAPPSGTHGPDRSRLDFSNFGEAVDAQGWGREVTTAGYGDLQGGSDEDYWYTNQFAGTSSASPMVVGAIASIQGHLRACGVQPLTLDEVILTLRATGSPQQPNLPRFPASQRIGNRPDLPAATRHARSLRGLPNLP